MNWWDFASSMGGAEKPWNTLKIEISLIKCNYSFLIFFTEELGFPPANIGKQVIKSRASTYNYHSLVLLFFYLSKKMYSPILSQAGVQSIGLLMKHLLKQYCLEKLSKGMHLGLCHSPDYTLCCGTSQIQDWLRIWTFIPSQSFPSLAQLTRHISFPSPAETHWWWVCRDHWPRTAFQACTSSSAPQTTRQAVMSIGLGH